MEILTEDEICPNDIVIGWRCSCGHYIPVEEWSEQAILDHKATHNA